MSETIEYTPIDELAMPPHWKNEETEATMTLTSTADSTTTKIEEGIDVASKFDKSGNRLDVMVRPDAESDDDDEIEEGELLSTQQPRRPQRKKSIVDAALEELDYIEANRKLERVSDTNQITASNIHVDSKLGEGSFAMALKVKVKGAKGFDDKQHYALKCLNADTKSSEEEQVEKALEDLAVEGTCQTNFAVTFLR